jgi:DNA-directed DNA polymerase III PolC
MAIPYVHLNTHSNFSLLSGTATVEQLAAAAREAGMDALALTDTNGLYAAVPFHQACVAEGVRPIYGAELEVGAAEQEKGGGAAGAGEDGQWDGRGEKKRESGRTRREAGPRRRAVLLARDREGYAEICRAVTARHLEADFDLDACLAEVSPRVVVLTADLPLLETLASARDGSRGRQGPENVYVELANVRDAASRRHCYRLLTLSEKLGFSAAATNRVHLLAAEDHFTHRLLAAMRTNTTVGTLPAGAAVDRENHFKAPQQMAALFHDLPQALRNTAEIAWSCRVDLEIGRPKLPRFPVPEGESSFSWLCKLAFQGLEQRYRPITREAYDTLNRELDVISRLELEDYFLVCHDIVRFARQEGMPCLGRGSAANSIVSFCLFITHVDPLRHNLFFERFLNLERESMPDFDIDFGTDDREEVLDYIFRRHGSDRVAMICTYSTMRARSAIREVAAALGIPAGEIDAVVKKLPHFGSADGVAEAAERWPESRGLPLDREPFRSILEAAGRINGFPHHLATHPCGLVVAPGPITDHMPLQLGDKGLPITQWSMYPVEDAGLLKIDILGQKGLAVISETKRAVAAVEDLHGDDPLRCLDDPLTREMMREGKSEGCFYIESPGMIQLIRQTRCDDFEVLTAISSIIRPGVSNHGGKRQYVRRHLGLEPVSFLHPRLEPVLADTYGCLIYQEQVIRVASELAGMSLSEADGLRKCMSKKRNWERMENYRHHFFRGAAKNGVPDDITAEIFRQIESFAGYAFCKAHSASFALESFESMYWKAHHPAHFMAAVLSNQGGYYSSLEYVEEARRLGLEILLPCVNRGEVRFSGEGKTVRVGLMQIKGVRSELLESIVGARHEDGPFTSVDELVRRVEVRPERAELEALARCGALDCLGRTRPELLWLAGLLCSGPDKGCPPDFARLAEQVPQLEDYPRRKKLLLELDLLGITATAHPLELFEERLARVAKQRPLVRSIDLERMDGETAYCFGWKVTTKRTRTEKKNEPMAFVTFSDPHGRYEATFFPRVYRRYAAELSRASGPFLVKGRVEDDHGAPNLIAEGVKLLCEEKKTADRRRVAAGE